MSKRKKHGLSSTKLYRIWIGIKNRCENQSCQGFINVGARGIVMHESWSEDFLKFREWALNSGYKEGLCLARNDMNEDYTPRNCMWVTYSKMRAMSNRKRKRLPIINLPNYCSKRSIIYVIINGKKLTLRQVSNNYNIKFNTVRSRFYSGKRGNELIEVVK